MSTLSKITTCTRHMHFYDNLNFKNHFFSQYFTKKLTFIFHWPEINRGHMLQFKS